MPLDTATPVVPLRHVPPPPRTLLGRPLGEILVLTGALAQAKLDEALAAQRGEHAGARLGEILVRMKALAEEEVLRALALQLDLPYLERVDGDEAAAQLAKKVPINFAKQAKILPLGA